MDIEFSSFSMIVGQFNIKRILSFKAENDAPIGSHSRGPESLQVAFQRVQAITGQIETLRRCRRIENRKDSFHRVQEVGAYPASVAAFIEALEASMFEAPNHKNAVYSDNRHLSIALGEALECLAPASKSKSWASTPTPSLTAARSSAISWTGLPRRQRPVLRRVPALTVLRIPRGWGPPPPHPSSFRPSNQPDSLPKGFLHELDSYRSGADLRHLERF